MIRFLVIFGVAFVASLGIGYGLGALEANPILTIVAQIVGGVALGLLAGSAVDED